MIFIGCVNGIFNVMSFITTCHLTLWIAIAAATCPERKYMLLPLLIFNICISHGLWWVMFSVLIVTSVIVSPFADKEGNPLVLLHSSAACSLPLKMVCLVCRALWSVVACLQDRAAQNSLDLYGHMPDVFPRHVCTLSQDCPISWQQLLRWCPCLV